MKEIVAEHLRLDSNESDCCIVHNVAVDEKNFRVKYKRSCWAKSPFISALSNKRVNAALIVLKELSGQGGKIEIIPLRCPLTLFTFVVYCCDVGHVASQELDI